MENQMKDHMSKLERVEAAMNLQETDRVPIYDILTNENARLFKAWNKHDPVDEWECERAHRIEEIQKNENPFVKKACAAEGLW